MADKDRTVWLVVHLSFISLHTVWVHIQRKTQVFLCCTYHVSTTYILQWLGQAPRTFSPEHAELGHMSSYLLHGRASTKSCPETVIDEHVNANKTTTSWQTNRKQKEVLLEFFMLFSINLNYSCDTIINIQYLGQKRRKVV